ncbi:MAG: aldo/keto reductase [Propionibacteriaceae bacterium]|jgi:D-threo-aldose 1-dehydrogenase
MTTASRLPRREIRRTGVHLTTLGFGAAPIAGLYQAVDETTAQATINAAWEGGIRYFDTAPHYGLGLSERRLGEALRDRPRDDVVISSKVGRLLIPRRPPLARDDDMFDVPGDLTRRRDYSRDGVLRSLEATLQRTGLDRVDILYVHDPDEHWQQAAEQAVPALVELREAGVVGAIGVGMNQSAMLARFIRHTDVDVVMLAGRYTLLEQGAADDLLPTALEQGRSVVAAAVFNSGLLARAEVPEIATYDYKRASPDVLERARLLASACREHGTTLPAAAIQFPLRHPAVASVVVGMRDPEEVHHNLAAHAQHVPDDLFADLEHQGLITGGETRS